MCRGLFNANHWWLPSDNKTHAQNKRQRNKNPISCCAQMVPLTTSQSVATLCLSLCESLLVCLFLYSERLQLQMVL